MKFLQVAAVSLAWASLAVPAFAHTTIVSSNIEDGAELTTVPASFDFSFGAEVGLAGLELETLEGETIDIGFERPPEMGTDFSVAMPAIAPGEYILKWRAVAKDGHVMKGEVDFTVTA